MAVISEYIYKGLNITAYNNKPITHIYHDGTVFDGLPQGDYHFAKENEVTDGVCDNAVAEPIIDMRVKGDSVQTTYTGKNLFDSNTSNIQSLLYQEGKYRWGYDFGILPVGDYTISFKLVDETVVPEYVYIMIKDETGYLARVGALTLDGTVSKNPFKFTVTEAQNYYFMFASGTTSTLDDALNRMAMFDYVQLEKGSVATDYEPYVGGQPSPNPEYPQEVYGVGNRTKNLFDIDYSNLERVPYTSTAERWGYDVGILPAGDYVVSFELVDENDVPNTVYLRKKDSQGTVSTAGSLTTSVITNNPLKFTADGATSYYILCASNSVGTLEHAIERMSKFKWIQLELGSTATEYEPYGYKIPIKITPTEYLFTPDKIAVHQINPTASRCGFDLGVLDAGDYTIDFDLVEAGKFPEYVYMRCKYADGTYSDNIYITSTVNLAPETFTTDGQSNYYLFFAQIPSDIEEAKKQFSLFRNVYLQKGSSIQNTSTTIYLAESLKKIGDYIDYIDYKNKKVIRNVKSFTPNGNESWLIDTSSGYNRYQRLLSDALIGDKSLSLCNMFNWVSGNSQDNSFVIGNRTPYLYIRYDSVADVDGFKEFLANNNLEVVYPLETSIEESIDIPTFETFDGTTIVDIDTEIQPSGMNITYWKQITPEEVNDV